MSDPDKMTFYTLILPTTKCGDDLRYEVERLLASDQDCPDVSRQALDALADTYTECSKLCRKLAGAAAECPEIVVDGDEYRIGVDGPPERLSELTRQGLLTEETMSGDELEAAFDGIPDEPIAWSSSEAGLRPASFDLSSDGSLILRSGEDWMSISAEGTVCLNGKLFDVGILDGYCSDKD